ncbi:hypothetical protein WA026_009515 [Henosepilachna vigintioctopunctata]|uniref:Uncharacterized protein n=1 Tax=Henosepilachna vigintioctopunctata TaxID=420089 RepID=A0AAW1U670_9CUCU
MGYSTTTTPVVKCCRGATLFSGKLDDVMTQFGIFPLSGHLDGVRFILSNGMIASYFYSTSSKKSKFHQSLKDEDSPDKAPRRSEWSKVHFVKWNEYFPTGITYRF